MHTITDIVMDVGRGCTANNMAEDKFSYRLVYFVNGQNGNEKYCIDVQYGGLRVALENVVRKNLTTTNSVVLAAVTARKNGEAVSLLSRSYGFSLEEYFQWVTGRQKRRNAIYNSRYATATYGN